MPVPIGSGPGTIEKKQSPVEGMPVLLRTGEMGNGAQQY